MLYSLTTEDGNISWPKDSTRREILYSAEAEAGLRRRLLKDVHVATQESKVLLAPGWCRQLMNEEGALEVEALLANSEVEYANGKRQRV